MPRVLAYLRNSSDRQAKAATINAQRAPCRELAARLGIAEVIEFPEEGVSGAASLEERPAMRRLLAAMRAGDVVVSFALDRLSRSDDEIDRAAIYGSIRRVGARVETVLDGAVDSDTMGGRILHAIKQEVAAEERRKILARTAAGKAEHAARGLKPQGATPYGLSYDREGERWGLDEFAAPVVRDLFARLLAGATCSQIGAAFTAAGHRTPRGRSKVWTARMVWQLATRPTYCGDWSFAGRPIAVPAIVDRATWQTAQAQLLAAGKRGLRRTQHVYLCDEGVGRCGVCAGPLFVRWGGTGGRTAYYLCPRKCGGWHRVEAIDEEVMARICAALRRPDVLERAMAGNREVGEDAAVREMDAAGYERKIARLDEVEAAILSRFRRGVVSEAGMERECGTIARERALLVTSAAAAREAAGRARSSITSLRGLREAAAALSGELLRLEGAERREAVRGMRTVVEVTRDVVDVRLNLRLAAPIGVAHRTCSCTESHCAHSASDQRSVEIAIVA